MRKGWASLVSIPAAAFLVANAAPSSAQDLSAKVETWLKTEWEAAAKIPDLSPHAIHWVLEMWWYPDAVELDRLRDEVRGRPDHPQAHLLPQYE